MDTVTETGFPMIMMEKHMVAGMIEQAGLMIEAHLFEPIWEMMATEIALKNYIWIAGLIHPKRQLDDIISTALDLVNDDNYETWLRPVDLTSYVEMEKWLNGLDGTDS